MEMVDKMKAVTKYPKYKNSGVKWLTQVPSDWGLKKMKFLFKDVSVKNKPEEELLSVTQNQGVVPRSWVENRMVMPTGNLESFKFIRKGNFAISLRSFEGGLEFCYHDGIISPAYTVLKMNENLYPGYYRYLFKSLSFISEIQTSVVGIREGKNISYPELSQSLIPIPNIAEQKAIAEFLDDKTSKIDRAIAQKERMIELLKERRQIIIQNAVTKGLDPSVKMKDSGVDWIGEIPEHWEVSRLGSNFEERKTKVSDKEYPPLSVTKNGIVPQLETAAKTNDGDNRKLVKEGDFVINSRSDRKGSSGIAFQDGSVSLINIVMTPKSIDPKFCNYLMKSTAFVEENYRIGHGIVADLWTTRYDEMKNIKAAFPPKQEQIAISSYVEYEIKKITKILELQEQQIFKLQEYKSTLVDSAVTGKIKVC